MIKVSGLTVDEKKIPFLYTYIPSRTKSFQNKRDTKRWGNEQRVKICMDDI